MNTEKAISSEQISVKEEPKKKAPKIPRLHNEVYHDTSRCGKRKDGSSIHHDCWRTDISVIEPDGTIRRIRRRFKTEEDARKFQREINATIPPRQKGRKKKEL